MHSFLEENLDLFWHDNVQIQFHTGLFQGTCCCWKRNLEANLTEQVPLLWGHRKVSAILENRATRIPWIRFWSWGGRERLRKSN